MSYSRDTDDYDEPRRDMSHGAGAARLSSHDGGKSGDGNDEILKSLQAASGLSGTPAGAAAASLFDSSSMAKGKGKESEGLTTAFTTALPLLINFVHEGAHKHAERIAKHWMGWSDREAIKFGEKAGGRASIALIAALPAYRSAAAIYASGQAAKEVLKAAGPLAKAGGDVKHNEVIGVAYKKNYNVLLLKLLDVASSSIGLVPAYWVNSIKQHEMKQKYIDESELKLLQSGDKEAAKALAQKKINLDNGIRAMEVGLNEACELRIAEETKAYLKGFEEFKAKEGKKIEKEFIEKINDAAAEFKEGNVTRDNIDRTRLREFEQRYDLTLTETKQTTAKNRNGFPVYEYSAKSNWNRSKSGQRAIDQYLKESYAKRAGALDESWMEGGGRGRSGYGSYGGYRNEHQQETVVGGIRKFYKKQRDDYVEGLNRSKQSHEKEKNGSHDNMVNTMTTLLFGGVGAFFGNIASKALVGEKAFEKYQKPIALDLIDHLRNSVEQGGGKLDSIPAYVNSHNKEDKDELDIAKSSISFTQALHEIFQTHQRDMGRPQIAERDFTHAEDAKFDDEKIFAMKDSQLTPYEYALKHIAKRIKDGRMDPRALINLVGDKHHRIVQPSGKAFGPAGLSSDDKQIKEALHKEIEQQSIFLRPSKALGDEEISEAKGAFAFDPQAMQFFFSHASAEEQALVAYIIDDKFKHDIEEVCKACQKDKKYVDGLLKQGQQLASGMIDAGIVLLAEVAREHPESLANLKLTEEELEHIARAAGRIQKGEKSVVENTDKETRESLEVVLANAVVSLDKKDGNGKEGFWQRMVQKGNELKAKVAAVEKKEEKAAKNKAAELLRSAEEHASEPEMDGGEGTRKGYGASKKFATREEDEWAESRDDAERDDEPKKKWSDSVKSEPGSLSRDDDDDEGLSHPGPLSRKMATGSRKGKSAEPWLAG